MSLSSTLVIQMLDRSISMITPVIRWKFSDDESNLRLIKEFELADKNRKGVINFIDMLLRSIENKGKKAGAFTDESARIKQICNAVTNRTDLGIKMIEAYYNKFGKKIERAEAAGGKKDHYDLIIYHDDGTTKKCEEKGTKEYSSKIDSSTPPHENSVQIYNGPAKYFSISRKYLECWYSCNVNNLTLKTEFGLPEIPSFDEWLEGGPYCMMNPSGEYSKTLKRNYREKYGASVSMNGFKQDNPVDYRKKPNEEFTLSDTDKATLIQEVQERYDSVLKEKEVWLQTTGNPSGKFSFCWYPNIPPKIIKDVVLKKKKDIEFEFIFNDSTSFTGIMRWGKGCGFSCFRMDFK